MVTTGTPEQMVFTQIVARGIDDAKLLAVMGSIPRHLFVDEALADRAYNDAPLPIGEGQTISQPYIVARMTAMLQLTGDEEILEVGTGSGYQTAVLARLCRKVFTIERLPSLAEAARKRLLCQLGIYNVVYRVGDGSLGWPEQRLFDRILVTAGAPAVPERLTAQLTVGGMLVLPEGDIHRQHLVRVVRYVAGIRREQFDPCRFVPLVGDQAWSLPE
ncbi:MAG: protein-L-isoaspartate(D-aspartate) O-methyltransferase [Magnetococcales bacterium]|nr:protein-L-isoaspartate(D-aspartate) O-methyltransferase [Magnetococcales bacterium]